MRTIRSTVAMQRQARLWQCAGKRTILVPTMGALHEGHLSLVRKARKLAGRRGVVIVSIYVNPTQFGPKEDLSRYPRNLSADLARCREAQVDVVFAPSDLEMYPGKGQAAFSTYVEEKRLSQSMEGASRPGHFRGVTTIVAKLFNLVLPGLAVFGAKDYQQAAIVKRMVRDLNWPVRIVIAPIVREHDGLAMSSRNKYLDAHSRSQATVLRRALKRAAHTVKVARGPVTAKSLKQTVAKMVGEAKPARLDYVELFHPDTLEPVSRATRGTHLALAVFFGQTRLIDNARL